MVATPLINMASCGLRPMTRGNTNVAPNIATTCCAPSPTVRGQDRRSSGRTTAPGGGVLPPYATRQPTPALFGIDVRPFLSWLRCHEVRCPDCTDDVRHVTSI